MFFLGIWLLHYGNRGFIFPLLMRVAKGSKGSFSLLVIVMGWVVTTLHGYLNAVFIAHLSTHMTPDWFSDPRFIIGMVIVFLLTPYTLNIVGIDQFGLWSLCLSVAGLLALLDMGFSTATVKYVAECNGSHDHEARNQAVSTLFLVYTGQRQVSESSVWRSRCRLFRLGIETKYGAQNDRYNRPHVSLRLIRFGHITGSMR